MLIVLTTVRYHHNTDKPKSMGRKVGFTAVFTVITRREAQPEETFIHIAEMKAIKVALEEKTKDR